MTDQTARTPALPIIGAGLLISFVVAVGFVGSTQTENASADSIVGATFPELAEQPSPTSSPNTTPTGEPPVVDLHDADATTSRTELETTLGIGSSGDDVRRLQQRLDRLGFVPGGDDGYFGDLTQQAVWAFEKAVLEIPRDDVTGLVTPDTWTRIMDPDTAVEPRRPEPGTANHTEIYLPEQVMAVFHEQQPVFVAHMSHGTGDEWCREVTISPGEYGNEDSTEPLHVGRCGVSNTPGGVFEYDRMVDGRRESALGGMLNPVYFNYGIAVHGAYNVPNSPASHGCVRIPNEISELYQSAVDIGERVFVWDGVNEPEHYGAQPPTFDWQWDDYEPRATAPTTTTAAPTPTTPTATAPIAPATTTISTQPAPPPTAPTADQHLPRLTSTDR